MPLAHFWQHSHPAPPKPFLRGALVSCYPVTAVSAWAVLKAGPLNPDLSIFQVFKLWLWISAVFPCGSAPQNVGGPRAYPGLLNVLVIQSCLTLCDPIDYSLPGSPVHGISQARILEWIDIPYSRGSSRPRDQTQDSCMQESEPPRPNTLYLCDCDFEQASWTPSSLSALKV